MAIPSRGLSGEISLVTFSLILGLIFWAIVKQQETVSQTILVPVTLANQPEFLELESFEPSNLAVKFSLRSGDETLARDPARFRINVDLGGLRNRVAISDSFVDYPIDITRDMLEYPDRLTFSSFDDAPARVVVRARPRIVRVPVEPQLQNTDSPAEGYQVDLANVVVEPSEVLVAVDEARHILALQGQLSVTTEPVDLRGRRDQVAGLYALELSGSRGVFPLPGQAVPSVEVIVAIPEIQGRRVFEDLPIRYQPLKTGRRAVLEPSTATVAVEGPQSVVNRLDPAHIVLSPRQVAFLDDETIGDIVDTSIEVRFEGATSALADDLRPPIVTPSLVKVTFLPIEEEAEQEAEQELEEGPVEESEEPEEADETAADTGVDPTPPDTTLEPLPDDPPGTP